MQIFPENLRKLWNKWDLRVAILLSLCYQIVLIVLGNRRQYIAKNWLRILLWFAYLSADWVATVSLGILSNNQEDFDDDPHYVIMAFWAPFLLLHLGGPDTITAYSLEDNELWLRHMLGLLVQVGVALYVLVRSLVPTQLNLLSIPVFVAGVVKYAERTWALRSASSKHFRQSLLPHPDPGPNYAKFMEEYNLKEHEGFEVSWTAISAPKVAARTYTSQGISNLISDGPIYNAAYDFFMIYKRLFADLILSFQDLEKTKYFFQRCTWEEAFKVIEIELGFVYDVLYTKAAVVYSNLGCWLRSISLCSIIATLVAFTITDKHQYSKVDVSISYLLLAGAIGLEVFAITILLSSDWMILWLIKHENSLAANIYRLMACLKFVTEKRWSNEMGQYNLLTSCYVDKPAKCCGIPESACIHKLIENNQQEIILEVLPCLKEHIFKQLKEKSNEATSFIMCKKLCAFRGEQALRKKGCYDKLGWSLEVEFDNSILLWHMATNLCYCSDYQRDQAFDSDPSWKVSRLLSNYMLYILVKRPFMLPNGIGQIRFQDTIAEAMEFIRDNKTISGVRQAAERMLKVETRFPPAEVKGDRSKSVLFDACRLAKLLQSLETEEHWETKLKWEMISEVWIEMLSYAASQCRWNHHAQQIRLGGELLTHVWLLMAHLGLTKQFQISQGHARAKLVSR